MKKYLQILCSIVATVAILISCKKEYSDTGVPKQPNTAVNCPETDTLPYQRFYVKGIPADSFQRIEGIKLVSLDGTDPFKSMNKKQALINKNSLSQKGGYLMYLVTLPLKTTSPFEYTQAEAEKYLNTKGLTFASLSEAIPFFEEHAAFLRNEMHALVSKGDSNLVTDLGDKKIGLVYWVVRASLNAQIMINGGYGNAPIIHGNQALAVKKL